LGLDAETIILGHRLMALLNRLARAVQRSLREVAALLGGLKHSGIELKIEVSIMRSHGMHAWFSLSCFE